MSDSLLQQKRLKLQREIDIAKQRLQQNFKSYETSDLLPNYNEVIPNLLVSRIGNQENTISQIETISNVVFPKNTFIQSLLKMLRLYFLLKK